MFTVLSVRNRAEFKDKSLKEMCVIVGVQVCMREEGDQVQKEKSYLGRGETLGGGSALIFPICLAVLKVCRSRSDDRFHLITF